LPKCVAHVRKSENSGDRHFQFLSCDEVGELGKYRRRCRIASPLAWTPNFLTASKSAIVFDLIWCEFQVFDRHGDISTTEKIEQRVDMSGIC
jgi:hypothetical protein